ncbi:MAG: diacylglycerol kinase [Pirellulaceae bacterium]|nr:diacylglycerol kinase [Planctomycetales bacterium]
MSEDERTTPTASDVLFSHAGRGWVHKFSDAFAGAWLAMRTQSSFHVHLAITVLVIAAAWWLTVSLVEWCLLILCVALVMSAECINTALERLAKAVDLRVNSDIGAALDIASGGVLIASAGAVLVGGAILGYRLGVIVGWWG